MAAPTTVLTIIKEMSYRGNPAEQWSNTYALSGSTPVDAAAWKTLFDAVVAEEKKVYYSASKVVAGYGYDGIPARGDHAIWSTDLKVSPLTPVSGTLLATGAPFSGDQAGWVRWGLDRFNSKGKRIFLRKYFHSGQVTSGVPDQIDSNYLSALNAFGAKMMAGTLAGTRTIVDKDGNVPISTGASSWATTRTLKRRGKRPPT